jgi:rare lipoprotein A
MTLRLLRWTALQLPIVMGGCALVGYPAPVPGDPGAPGMDPVATPATEPRSAYGNPDSYEVFGDRYHVLPTPDGYEEEGLASWYGAQFAGRRTSSGEIFDPRRLSAAHRTLPIPTWVEVINLDNGRELLVRVNDRGPFVDTDQRIIDLSRAAAERLGMVSAGTARVRVRALSTEELGGGD